MKKYEQVTAYLKEKIAAGTYPVGSRIPSEEELIALLGISRTPVRKALDALAEEGAIYKIQGSGSFVKNRSIPEPVNIYAILHWENSFLESRIIEGMRRAVDDSSFKNIHLILNKPGKNTVKQIEILNMIPVSGKGGVICVPMVDEVRAGNRLLGANLRKIEKAGFPVILLDKSLPEYRGSSIMTVHETAAARMTEFLFSQGHRNIAVFYTHANISSVKLRLRGIRGAFQQAGGEAGRLHLTNLEEEPLRAETVEALRKQGVTAFFSLECEIARQFYTISRETGKRIPEDYSLCSFDDHCFHDFKGDFLTAVSQRLQNIGYYAVQLVLDKIQKKTEGNIHMLVESDIVRRKSVAKI